MGGAPGAVTRGQTWDDSSVSQRHPPAAALLMIKPSPTLWRRVIIIIISIPPRSCRGLGKKSTFPTPCPAPGRVTGTNHSHRVCEEAANVGCCDKHIMRASPEMTHHIRKHQCIPFLFSVYSLQSLQRPIYPASSLPHCFPVLLAVAGSHLPTYIVQLPQCVIISVFYCTSQRLVLPLPAECPRSTSMSLYPKP
jgi:hypothetical protein